MSGHTWSRPRTHPITSNRLRLVTTSGINCPLYGTLRPCYDLRVMIVPVSKVQLRRDEDGVWIARSSLLPGCHAHGRDRGEALLHFQQAAKAHLESLQQQVDAARAAVELARSNLEQVKVRENDLAVSMHQLAAAGAQKKQAQVRLDYTEIRSPLDGFVDTRAALQGEVVNVAQPIVTLINPDNLWVRIDVPETYIDGIHLDQQLPVRLPSGEVRTGTVFYRGADASFATQRDVSRTKRDIKTFEVRLRVDNRDRALAVGMSAYVTVPVGKK